MGMTPLTVSRRIGAPARVVWRLLVDTHMWTQWGPSVNAVDLKERTIHLDSRGQVKVLGLLWLPFEVTHFDPGRYWSWRVGGIPATGHRVDALTARCCRLSFEVPLWGAPYSLVFLLAIKRIQRLTSKLPQD